VLETVPQFVPLQPAPVIDQLTDWLLLKQTLAVNGCRCPKATVAADGETVIGTGHAAVTLIDAEAVSLGSAVLVTTRVTGFTGGSDAGAV